MRRFWERLVQFFCLHEWRISRFQALNGGTSFKCSKCGKYRTHD